MAVSDAQAQLIQGGTGILNAIVPVWASECADHTSRGQFIAIEFTLNIFGVVVAYWLEFGLTSIDGGYSAIRWRFPVAFQIFPLLGLLAAVWFFPESPRWLTKVGREDEARYILGRLRGTEGEGALAAEAEAQEIKEVARQQVTNAIPTDYFAMVTGRGTGALHIGRRVQLVIWLQIIQQWVGIAGVTIYAPTIFRLAGFSADKSQWISGLNNIFYMFSTLICVFTLDRIGRRWTLYWGSVMQGISMFLCGAFTRLGLDADMANDTAAAGRYGIAAASMVFLFTFTFGATWLTVPWLYPAEIFPLAVRAKGNALGVVGWSIGNGWLVSCPDDNADARHSSSPCASSTLARRRTTSSALPTSSPSPLCGRSTPSRTSAPSRRSTSSSQRLCRGHGRPRRTSGASRLNTQRSPMTSRSPVSAASPSAPRRARHTQTCRSFSSVPSFNTNGVVVNLRIRSTSLHLKLDLCGQASFSSLGLLKMPAVRARDLVALVELLGGAVPARLTPLAEIVEVKASQFSTPLSHTRSSWSFWRPGSRESQLRWVSGLERRRGELGTDGNLHTTCLTHASVMSIRRRW
jgi:MFS family permease